jgi:hypothetical protein
MLTSPGLRSYSGSPALVPDPTLAHQPWSPILLWLTSPGLRSYSGSPALVPDPPLAGLFYASMATLNGQGRPLPVALAFFLGAFLLAPARGYVFAFVLHCCGAIKLYVRKLVSRTTPL